MKNVLLAAILVAPLFVCNQGLCEALETTQDIRCLAAIFSSIGVVSDKSMQGALQVSALYYLGRLDGRAPELDLEKRLIEEISKMAKQDMGSEDIRCGKFLAARGEVLKQIGKDMVAKGQQRSSLP